jgi:hypothetical protein
MTRRGRAADQLDLGMAAITKRSIAATKATCLRLCVHYRDYRARWSRIGGAPRLQENPLVVDSQQRCFPWKHLLAGVATMVELRALNTRTGLQQRGHPTSLVKPCSPCRHGPGRGCQLGHRQSSGLESRQSQRGRGSSGINHLGSNLPRQQVPAETV